MSEESGVKQMQSDNSVTLSEAQYEDMKRIIRSLKSQLKESETTCFLIKQVAIIIIIRTFPYMA